MYVHTYVCMYVCMYECMHVHHAVHSPQPSPPRALQAVRVERTYLRSRLNNVFMYVCRCTHIHTCVHMEETMKFLNAVHAQDAIMGSCVCMYVHRICERKRVPTSSSHLLAPPHPTSLLHSTPAPHPTSLSSPGAGDVPRWPQGGHAPTHLCHCPAGLPQPHH